MVEPARPRYHFAHLRAEDPTPAGDLAQLADNLAAPFVEHFRDGLEAGDLARAELPHLIESACSELAQFFLEDARVNQEFDAVQMSDLREYTDLVIDLVRDRLLDAMGLAE